MSAPYGLDWLPTLARFQKTGCTFCSALNLFTDKKTWVIRGFQLKNEYLLRIEKPKRRCYERYF